MFRKLRDFTGHRSYRLDALFDYMIAWIQDENYVLRFNRSDAPVIQEASQIMEQGKMIVENAEKVIAGNSDHEEEVIGQYLFQSSWRASKYRACLKYMACSCQDYLATGRNCKHLYAAILCYMKEHNLHALVENPFHYIHLTHVHIHYPSEFETLYTAWNGLFPRTNLPPTLPKGRPVVRESRSRSNRLSDYDNPVYVKEYLACLLVVNCKLHVKIKWETFPISGDPSIPYSPEEHAEDMFNFIRDFENFILRSKYVVLTGDTFPEEVNSLERRRTPSNEQNGHEEIDYDWFMNGVPFHPQMLSAVRDFLCKHRLIMENI